MNRGSAQFQSPGQAMQYVVFVLPPEIRSAYNPPMCLALPARVTGQTRRSWLPESLRMVLGGLAFIGILSTCFLLDRFSHRG